MGSYLSKWTRMLTLPVLLLGVVGIVLVGCGEQTGPAGEEEYSFRYSEVHPEGYPSTIAAERFAELVEERSDGRIMIEVFPGGQLGDPSAVIEQIQGGSIAFTDQSTSTLTGFSEGVAVFDLPYLFEDEDSYHSFLNGEGGQELLDSLQDDGLKGLAYYDAGARSFYTADKVVETPEDMQGLLIRVQPSEIMTELVETLGASPSTVAYGEVYSALQSGVIGGAENNWPSYESSAHYEVAPNYTLNQHTRVPDPLIMSQQVWDTLGAEDQELIQQAAEEAADVQWDEWQKRVEEAKETARSEGVNVIEVDDLSPWQEAVEPLIDEYRSEYSDSLEAIEESTEQQ